MIDEAIGKILGMAMAYGASALGMFVAYVNYRKRIVKADKIMTPAAWMVILLSVLAVGGAVLLGIQFATTAAEAGAGDVAAVQAPVEKPEVQMQAPMREVDESQGKWPLVGIVLPLLIFLFATWITAALHRHFSTQGH